MEEGKEEEEGDNATIPGFEVIWEEAPESRTHSLVLGGGLRLTVLKAAARD
jgi:hypothetical protein